MCRKWRGGREGDEKENALSCWTCCWFSAGLKAGYAALRCAVLSFISIYFFRGFFIFFLSFPILLLLPFFAASLKDNNINAGNLNGRAQWMKFANIFQKLNFSGKFFRLLRLSAHTHAQDKHTGRSMAGEGRVGRGKELPAGGLWK